MFSLFILFKLFSISLAINVNKTIRLNSGNDCPVIGLGFGGYSSGGFPRDPIVKQMIKDAIDAGYRHFDTADLYGNEEDVGNAINEVINEGKVKRRDIFITTKIFSKYKNERRGRREAFMLTKLALEKLNTGYIDLMLIHNPYDDWTNSQIWKGLEDAVKNGLVESIGVSNFNVRQLTSLLSNAKTVPAMNQIESHPLYNDKNLINFCKMSGISVTAYSPLSQGRLLTHPYIIEIGERYGKTAAQVLIRWQIQRGIIAIPKSTNKQRIEENINVFDFNLTNNVMQSFHNF